MAQFHADRLLAKPSFFKPRLPLFFGSKPRGVGRINHRQYTGQPTAVQKCVHYNVPGATGFLPVREIMLKLVRFSGTVIHLIRLYFL